MSITFNNGSITAARDALFANGVPDLAFIAALHRVQSEPSTPQKRKAEKIATPKAKRAEPKVKSESSDDEPDEPDEPIKQELAEVKAWYQDPTRNIPVFKTDKLKIYVRGFMRSNNIAIPAEWEAENIMGVFRSAAGVRRVQSRVCVPESTLDLIIGDPDRWQDICNVDDVKFHLTVMRDAKAKGSADFRQQARAAPEPQAAPDDALDALHIIETGSDRRIYIVEQDGVRYITPRGVYTSMSGSIESCITDIPLVHKMVRFNVRGGGAHRVRDMIFCTEADFRKHVANNYERMNTTLLRRAQRALGWHKKIDTVEAVQIDGKWYAALYEALHSLGVEDAPGIMASNAVRRREHVIAHDGEYWIDSTGLREIAAQRGIADVHMIDQLDN
jgi:hypothetical protein